MKKRALITGASSGIGLELAKIFASKGIDLLLIARNENALNKLQDELFIKYKVDVDIFPKDLSKPESADQVYEYCQQRNYQIDYLVNNAGFGDYGFFAESKWDKQLEMINLNITGLTKLTHLFLPAMLARKYGKIMQVASIASFLPGPLMSVYYATKAYVLHFSEAISNELEGTGITVTALCPGHTESGFQDAANLGESKLVKGRKLPSSLDVAKYGFNAMMKGKKVAIHGTFNYIQVNSIRFTPRNLVLKIARFIKDKK